MLGKRTRNTFAAVFINKLITTMKKIFLFLMLCSFFFTSIAENPMSNEIGVRVIFSPMLRDSGEPFVPGGNQPFPRTPILAPTVYLDNHTLLFGTVFGDDIEVQLLDPDTMEDDVPTVVYATTLTAGDDEITLPSSYTGEYGIRLVVGNWYFIGIVDL